MKKILKVISLISLTQNEPATDLHLNEPSIPLISKDESGSRAALRMRRHTTKECTPITPPRTTQLSTYSYHINEQEDEHLFASIGEPWELFKQKDYENAFKPIYLLAKKNNPQAQYLLGEIYENGLGKIFKSFKDASKWYTQATVNSNDLALKMKAAAGLNRTIANSSPVKIKESYKLDTYFQDLSIEDQVSKYNKEDLSLFLKYLKNRYTYAEIADKTHQFTKSTICKLTNHDDYGLTKDYEDFWTILRKEYSKEFRDFYATLNSKNNSDINYAKRI